MSESKCRNPLVNTVALSGRLGRDPEIKYLSTGTPCCRMSVAVDEYYTDAAKERQKRTHWIPVLAWGKVAEWAGAEMRKGWDVYIEGKLVYREWEKDGQKRNMIEVHARRIVPLEWHGAAGQHDGGHDARDSAPARDMPEDAPHQSEIPEDDIPF